MNLTNIIGKQVFALYEGEIIGTVVSCNFNQDFSKIKSIKIFNEDESEYEINFINIIAIEDCIIVSNKSKIFPYFDEQKNNPLNKIAISQEGKILGKITDCDIDKNGKLLNFYTTLDKKLSPKNIYLRNTFVFYSENKLKFSNLKPKNKIKTLQNIKVTILNKEEASDEQNFTPTRINFNPESIIGKIAKTTLLGTNNEIIIRSNQIISQKTIMQATKHNRLNQLYFLAI